MWGRPSLLILGRDDRAYTWQHTDSKRRMMDRWSIDWRLGGKISPRASRNCEIRSSSHHTAIALDASCCKDTQATNCDDDEDSGFGIRGYAIITYYVLPGVSIFLLSFTFTAYSTENTEDFSKKVGSKWPLKTIRNRSQYSVCSKCFFELIFCWVCSRSTRV